MYDTPRTKPHRSTTSQRYNFHGIPRIESQMKNKTLTSRQNPYKLGYRLHGYFPPKVCKLIFKEYAQQNLTCVLSPSRQGSFPSIWASYGVETRAVQKILKKYREQILLEQTRRDRK